MATSTVGMSTPQGPKQVPIYRPPSPTMPKNSAASSPGMYKGIAINPGSDSEVAAQIASIDKGSVAPTNGVKANAPGAQNQGSVNSLPPTYKAPQSAQSTVSNQGTSAQNNTQNAPTFGGIVGQLVNSSSQGSPYVPTAAAGLQGTAQANPGTSGPAYKNYQDAVQNLNQLKQQEATQLAGTMSQPIPLNFQQGRAQVQQSQYALQNDAAQQAVNQAQAALGYQIQGAQTQQTGFNQLGNLGVAQQGQLQSGLQGAAGYAQPQLGSIGQVPFSPLGQGQGQILGTQQAGGVQQAGNLLGQFSGAQAVGAAPGQAQASNIGTAGTAEAGAANTAYQGLYGQSVANNLAKNQVDSLGSLAIQTAQGGNINPFTLQAGNSTLAEVRRQLSSPGQAQFDQTMATFQAAMSQLLSGSSDVTPTQLGTWATQISNGTMPVATLQAIYQQALKEGSIKVGNINSAGNAAFGSLQNAAGGSGGSTGNIGGDWNF